MDTPAVPMDYLAPAALVVSLLIVFWLMGSLWSQRSFDAAIMPQYPPPAMQEQMNTGTTKSYLIYPRQPYA